MKKSKLLKAIAIFAVCLCAPILFSGCGNSEADPQNFRVQNGWVQYTKDGENWINLIEAEYPINEYNFRICDGYVQWTTDGETWTNLIKAEEDIKTYTISFDYGATYGATVTDSTLMPIFSKDQPQTLTVKEGEWITSLPQIQPRYEKSFKGWFIKGTNKQIDKYDYVAADITLEPRFDFSSVAAPAGLYENEKYIKTWQQLIDEEKIVVKDDVLTYGHIDGDLKIYDTVTKIGKNAFDDNSFTLTGIAIPDSVKTIESHAFDGCYSLKTAIIGNGVKIIGNYAFSSCRELTDVVIGEEVQIIDERAFYDCSKLSNITIPTSVVMINKNAFYNCNNLTSVNLKMSFREIWKIYNKDAVISQNAMLLTEKQVTWYLHEGYNFRQVYTYDNFDYVGTDSKTVLISVQDKSLLYSVKIENKVSSKPLEIDDYAFAKSTNLHTVTIAEDVEYIGLNAFSDCNALTTINFEEKAGYKWQVCENNQWRDAESSELFNLAKAGKELKRISE